MAAKIGDLIVELKANTAAFQADMGRATASVNAAAQQMRAGLLSVSNSFNAARSAAAAFGLGLGLGTLATMTARIVNAKGALGELAEQLGVSTNTLQELQFAAGQSGVKAQELETAIARLTRNIGEAANGADDAIKAFRGMGVGIYDAQGRLRSTSDILRDIAERIASSKDAAERGRIAYEAFGKSGQRLVPMLADGAAGLRRMAEEANNSGAVLDEKVIQRIDKLGDEFNAKLPAWQNSVVSALDFVFVATEKGVGRTIDQLKSLGNAYQTYLVEPLKRVLPSDQQIAGAVGLGGTRRFTGSSDPAMLGGSSPLGPVGPTRNPIPQRAQDAIEKLKDEKDGLSELNDAYQGYFSTIGEVETRIKAVAATRAAGAKAGSDEYNQIFALVTANDELSKSIRRAKESQEFFLQKATEQAKQDEDDRVRARERSDEILRQRAAIERSLENEADDTQRLTSALMESQRAYEQEAEFIRIRNQYRAAGIPLYGEEIDAARKLAARNVEANRNLERTSAASQELANFMDRGFDRIGGAITEATTRGKDGFIDMGSIGRAVLAELQQEAIKLSLINPFKNWAFGQNNPTSSDMGGGIFKWLGGLFGGASANGFSAGTASLPNFGASTVTPGFADGTPSAPPGWAVVGETGPELVKFRGGERVFSNAESQQLGGGQTINVYPDLRGASVEAVNALMREVRRLNASIEPRIVATVMGESGRGGRMREIMG